MDWAQPERSDVFISVMRLAAGDPTQRRGSLLFNPGGPGEDGLWLALHMFLAFDQSNPESAQGALQLRLLDSYDMVGFSPRGTGASTRLYCATNELGRPLVPSAGPGISDENFANAAYNDRKTAEACLRNPLTPYINTDATARDMDLMRQVLGEDKLNYLGYSYGTWLGGWYASLFPDKVGRMVLDSSMDYPSAMEKANLNQSSGFQTVYEEVLLPYAARHSDYFQLGSSTAGIAAMVQSLSPKMRNALGSMLARLSYAQRDADDYLAVLSSAPWVESTLEALPDAADKFAMQAALGQHVFVAGNNDRDQAVRTQAQELYNAYHQAFFAEPGNIRFSSETSTYWAVKCNDDAATTDPQAWRTIVRSTALHAPLFTELENPCIYWGGPRVTKPDISGMQGLDVLMVQSQYDAATPAVGANHFFAQLPNARRVVVPDEYQHTVFPYSDTCVDTTVVRYLLGETPTEREISCPAHLLRQDIPAAPTAPAEPATASQTAPITASKSMPKAAARAARAPSLSPPPGAEPPTYLHPEEAQKLIDRFKEGIGRRR